MMVFACALAIRIKQSFGSYLFLLNSRSMWYVSHIYMHATYIHGYVLRNCQSWLPSLTTKMQGIRIKQSFGSYLFLLGNVFIEVDTDSVRILELVIPICGCYILLFRFT